MSDSPWSRVSRGIRTLAAGTILSTAVSLISVPLAVRYLGKETYGRLVLLFSVYSVAGLLLNPGLGSWLVTSIARERAKNDLPRVRRMLRGFARYQATACVLLAVGGAVAYPLMDAPFSAWSMAVLIAYLALTIPTNLLEVTFFGFSDYRNQTLLSVLPGVVRLAGLLALPLIAQPSLEAVWGLYPLSLALASAALLPSWLRYARALPVAPAGPPMGTPSHLLEGQPKYYVLLTAIRRVRENLPIWFIHPILGSRALASFDVTFRLTTAIASFLKIVESAQLPEVSRLYAERPAEARRINQRGIVLSLILSCFAIPAAWLLARPVIHLLFGPDFDDAVWPFRIFVGCLIPWSFLFGQRTPFYSQNMTGQLCLAYALSTLAMTAWLFAFTERGLNWTMGVWWVEAILLVGGSSLLLRRAEGRKT